MTPEQKKTAKRIDEIYDEQQKTLKLMIATHENYSKTMSNLLAIKTRLKDEKVTLLKRMGWW